MQSFCKQTIRSKYGYWVMGMSLSRSFSWSSEVMCNWAVLSSSSSNPVQIDSLLEIWRGCTRLTVYNSKRRRRQLACSVTVACGLPSCHKKLDLSQDLGSWTSNVSCFALQIFSSLLEILMHKCPCFLGFWCTGLHFFHGNCTAQCSYL